MGLWDDYLAPVINKVPIAGPIVTGAVDTVTDAVTPPDIQRGSINPVDVNAYYEDPRIAADEQYQLALDQYARAQAGFDTEEIRDINPLSIAEIYTRDVNAPRKGEATDAGAVERYDAATVGDPTIDSANADAIRLEQTKNLAAITGAATGATPSVAGLRGRAEADDLTRDTMGAIGQARGLDRAGARREGLLNLADARIRLGQRTAAEEAAERMGYRAQLTGALTGVRGEDTALATRRAELGLAADTTNVGAVNAASQFGATAANARADDLATRKDAFERQNVDLTTSTDAANADRDTNVQTEMSRQYLDAQKAQNEQMIRRDTAESDRARGDFDSRMGAAQGALSAQGGAVQNKTAVAQHSVTGQQEEDRRRLELKQAEDEAELKKHAGSVNTVATAVNAAAGGKKPA